MNPTMGPKATPKNMGMATAGRTDTFAVAGICRKFVAQERTPYRAAPIAANTTSRVPNCHNFFSFHSPFLDFL